MNDLGIFLFYHPSFQWSRFPLLLFSSSSSWLLLSSFSSVLVGWFPLASFIPCHFCASTLPRLAFNFLPQPHHPQTSATLPLSQPTTQPPSQPVSSSQHLPTSIYLSVQSLYHNERTSVIAALKRMTPLKCLLGILKQTLDTYWLWLMTCILSPKSIVELHTENIKEHKIEKCSTEGMKGRGRDLGLFIN